MVLLGVLAFCVGKAGLDYFAQKRGEAAARELFGQSEEDEEKTKAMLKKVIEKNEAEMRKLESEME